MTTATELNDLRLSLEALPLQELRVKARKVYDISVTRDHKADEIVELIMNVAAKHDFAVVNAGDLKAGWSRIRLHPLPGRGVAPVYVNINGRSFGIPMNVDCDVPNKVVGVLRDAQEARPIDDDTPGVTSSIAGYRLEQSYPFTLIESKPGPDPRPGLEVQREAKLKSKRDFEKAHGFWPSDEVMKQQRQIAFLKS